MTAQELRVGNLIIANGLYEGKIVTVDYIGSAGTLKDDNRVILFKGEDIGEFVCDCIGIPLTEDWLRRLGFEKTANCTFERQFGKHSLHYAYVTIPNGGNIFSIGDRYSAGGERITVLNAPVEYVHQLQNLFFALTGEELKLKEE